MSFNNTMEQRKKLLEDALKATDNYEKSLKRIEDLQSRLEIAENKSKQAEKLMAENTKLKHTNTTLKSNITEVEKRCQNVENEVKMAIEKQTVLKSEIHKKDLALNKYKSRVTNGDKVDDSSELQKQLREKDKLVEVLKEELADRERIFIGADKWNRKCSIEKSALIEEMKKIKNDGNPDAIGKILSLEEIIVSLERELKSAKELNEQLACHIYGMEAKMSEIPKLESKIRILEMELDGFKNSKSNFESFFSKPPPIIKVPEQPVMMQHQLSDLEKQMAVMANEIMRLKSGADKLVNGKMH